jgi:hypothetical protein
MSIINLPLTRYEVISLDERSKFILYSVVGCDLSIELPLDQAPEKSIAIILNQIGAALNTFKSKNLSQKIYLDNSGKRSTVYTHEFLISVGNYTENLTFFLPENLIGENAFMLPERKSWAEEMTEILDEGRKD